MEINKDTRDQFITKLKKLFSENIANQIEPSVFNFSKEYAVTNDTPYLLDSIYDNKSDEVIAQLLNKESNYLVKAVKDKKIDPEKLAFMKPEELNPDKYDSIIKKQQMTEYKKNNTEGSNIFTCSKCKKSKCSVTTKQTRAGDEPPTTFVNCLECGHTFKFN
jgi:DNA-directed RNA polymerase subunit M/transcription elongation factor TFIIS